MSNSSVKLLIKKIFPHLIRLLLALGIVYGLNLLIRSLYSYQGHRLEAHQSLDEHSRKLSKYTFAGEVLPFDSPFILKRYQRAILLNKTVSRSNYRMIKASRRWFPIIEPILKRHGIPDDFKYIVAAESKFAQVVSHKGAGGFWQMMPFTARSLGLEVDDEVDERYHVTKSTEVACRFFKDSYRIFGDWVSVILAYNMGNTALYKLKRSQKQESAHFIRSNKETERYFYLVMAYKDLIENSENYGYHINTGGKVSEVRVVDVTQDVVDLKAFAKSQGIRFEVLKSFNPWIRKETLTKKKEYPRKKYQLLVPIIDMGEIIEEDEVEGDTTVKIISVKDTSLTL